MDKRKALTRDEALALVRKYKQVIRSRFDFEPKVMMFGSYSKGYANPDSDIDVAVVVSEVQGDFLKESAKLWRLTLDVNTLIEPILIESSHPSPLYEDILQSGILVA